MLQTKPKPRQIHWTCRKCRAKWSSNIPMPTTQRGMQFTEDCEMRTLCDECLDRIGERALKRY